MGAALLIEYRAQGMELENEAIGVLLAQRDETAFEQVFKTHFKRLHAYAFTILRDEEEAEEMVQQVFFQALGAKWKSLIDRFCFCLSIPGCA